MMLVLPSKIPALLELKVNPIIVKASAEVVLLGLTIQNHLTIEEFESRYYKIKSLSIRRTSFCTRPHGFP